MMGLSYSKEVEIDKDKREQYSAQITDFCSIETKQR